MTGNESESRISEIYQYYLNGREFDYDLEDLDIDLDWLEEKINKNDYMKLEKMIVNNFSAQYKSIFKAGFRHAWELFQECGSKELEKNEK